MRLTLIAVVLLGACQQSSVDERNASVEEVAKAVVGSDAAKFTPGRWETRVRVLGIDAPGLPPEAAAGVQQAVARAQVVATCLTPAQAANPEANFFNRDVKNCRYDRFTMAGGKIDAVMKCSAGDTTQTMTMAGDYSPDAYAMRMEMAHSGNGGRPGMTMAMRVNAKRIGECTGKEG